MNSNHISTRRQALTLLSGILGTGLITRPQAQAHGPEKNSAVKTLFSKELEAHPGEQASITEVTYAPGQGSAPHKHHGPVFVYVVEGAVELQIAGGPLTTVRAGETFYEPPGSVHLVSRNASKTQPSKLVAFIIGKTDTAVTSPLPE